MLRPIDAAPQLAITIFPQPENSLTLHSVAIADIGVKHVNLVIMGANLAVGRHQIAAVDELSILDRRIVKIRSAAMPRCDGPSG